MNRASIELHHKLSPGYHAGPATLSRYKQPSLTELPGFVRIPRPADDRSRARPHAKHRATIGPRAFGTKVIMRTAHPKRHGFQSRALSAGFARNPIQGSRR